MNLPTIDFNVYKDVLVRNDTWTSNSWYRAYIFAKDKTGRVYGRFINDTVFQWFDEYKPLEKKIVPIESVNEIPIKCIGQIVYGILNNKYRLLSVNDQSHQSITIGVFSLATGSKPLYAYDLKELAITKAYIKYHQNDQEKTFFFYKEVINDEK